VNPRDAVAGGQRVAPLSKKFDSARGFHVIFAVYARERPGVAAFVAWLVDEAEAERRDAGIRPLR
jgi:hypothetical protein